MRLHELLALRPVPAGGLLAVVTARCPLHCAHCSSDSTVSGPEPDAAALLRFVGSFAPAPPKVLLLTGGEPLLRPETVASLAAAARTAGTRTAVLTGAFFARDDRVPARIMAAIRALDHFSVSIDAFHEREIPRAEVFLLLRRVLDAGVHASIHAVGRTADDPYLADLIADVHAAFGDTVPMLVNTVRSVGRAAGWNTAQPAAPGPGAHPCPMAAWPVVTQDGTVTACCNQAVVDRRPVPAHLALGHIAFDDWASVRDRVLASPVLRTLRVAGPDYLRPGLADQDPADPAPAGGCVGCRALSERPGALQTARRLGSGPLIAMLDSLPAAQNERAAAVDLARRFGSAPHAELVAPPAGAEP